MKIRVALIAALCGFATVASADEGMWTYNNFPSKAVQQKYGFLPDQAFLDRAQLSSARLAGGCSASFVSPTGLVMTNHHCARGCIQQLSKPGKDLIANGFYAKTEKEELRCPAMEVNQLLEITDVTAKVNAASKGKTDGAYNEAVKEEMSKLEKECSKDQASVRCDVVELYQGGQYNLYRYKRYQDVRLSFAPEEAIAFFGGDPDNFNFPRYDLDLTFLRVYEGDKPAATPSHFKWSKAGVKDGDLTFVSGHPGSTSRLLTIAELEYQRDVALPERLFKLAEQRGLLTEYQRRGAEQKRHSQGRLFGVENGFKALKGRYGALVDKSFFGKKVAEEKAFREKIRALPAEKAKAYEAAFAQVEKAVEEGKKIRLELSYLEHGAGLQSELFGHARNLVRAAEELPKPNEKRLREYADSKLPALRQGVASPAPIYPELEIFSLTHSLTKLREELGPDHPFVKKVLGTSSPQEIATILVKESKLADPKLRQKLFDGGKDAVEKSDDAMIRLAKAIDADGRAIRKKYEDEIEAVARKATEQIARARFDVYGTSTYPDATFTLRLSYGTVKGWELNGKKVQPVTDFAGAYGRHTGFDPFALPKSWLAAQKTVEASTPFNFASTNDIIGGNSGSPVFNQQGEIVGLIFDGNIHSLGGAYGFDETLNRAVAVHSSAITEALTKVYKADRLAKELASAGGAPAVAAPANP